MENMNLKQLQAELRSRELPVNGSKRILLNRIREYDKKHCELERRSETSNESQVVNLQSISSSVEASADDNLRAKEWQIIEREKKLLERERQTFMKEQALAAKLKDFEARLTTNSNNRPKVICTIKEIADSIPSYSPGDVASLSTESWIKRVESLTKLYGWDERALLMAIASKMQGSARYWWDTMQEVCSSWSQLADGLRANFPHQISEIEIHQQLVRKVKKTNETVESYYFEMHMLGKRIELTDKTIIQYILTGLNDTQMSSSLAASDIKDIAELVEKIRWFESIRSNAKASAAASAPQRTMMEHRNNFSSNSNIKWQQRNPLVQQNNIICYNCNQPGHFSRQCTQTRKRPQIENGASSSNVKRQNNFSVNIVGCKSNTDVYKKNVTVQGKCYTAHLDSGCERTIISRAVARGLNNSMQKSHALLHGFGGGTCEAVGMVCIDIGIDGAVFTVWATVVEDALLTEDILIGKDILDNPTCILTKTSEKLTIQRIREIETDPSRFKIADIQIDDEVSTDVRNKVFNLLMEFRQCIAMTKRELGNTRITTMEIELEKKEPVVSQPYKVPYAQRETLNAIIEELLQCGIIKESQSSFASPVILVKKKNGEYRMCVDYRRLNKNIKKMKFPMPLMEEQLNNLAGCKYFIVLDMASGYYQIPIRLENTHYTAFITPGGLYEFLKMPFGLSTAPATFQKMMTVIVQKMKPDKVVNFVDDIVIPVNSINEGLSKLEKFLKLLKEGNLTLNLKKCHFFKTKIEFLGHIVTENAIQPGKLKTSSVEQFRTPSSEHEVRQFLGLTSYFRKFIKNFSTIALPLTELTKKDCIFHWGNSQQKAFEELRTALAKEPVLALYDQDAEHELHTDASAKGLAGVLMQGSDEKRPVGYFSRKTTEDESVYHSYELEALAVVEATNRFRQYLLGKHFVVITDCGALKTAMDKKELVPRIARWWLKMQKYDFEVKHRPGTAMAHADALSRTPHEPAVEPEVVNMDILQIDIETDDWIYTMQLQDPEAKEITRILQKMPANQTERQCHRDYRFEEGRLYRIVEGEIRLYIPKGIRQQMMRSSHDLVGHFSENKTFRHLRDRCWFPRMMQTVKRYIKNCVHCAYNKIEVQPRGELHTIEKKNIPFDTIHLDHLGPFVKSTKGNSYLIVMVDAFTKFLNMKALPNTQAKPVINFLTETSNLFGSPRRIITDRGAAFTSKLFQEYVRSHGIQHVLNATKTPRANGQVERYNRTILQALLPMVDEDVRWDQKIKMVQWGINNTHNEATQKTAQQMLMGYIPKDPWPNPITTGIVLNQKEHDLSDIRFQGHEAIKKSQITQKQRHDSKNKPAKIYAVGDLVMIFNDGVAATGTSRKLEPKYKGPYMVTAVLPHDRYQLGDIPLAPRTQKPFSSICAADRMKKWIQLSEELDEDAEEIRMDESET